MHVSTGSNLARLPSWQTCFGASKPGQGCGKLKNLVRLTVRENRLSNERISSGAGELTVKGRYRAQVVRAVAVAMPLLIFSVAVAALLDYFLYPVLVRPATTAFNRGENGLWLGSRWYLGKSQEKDRKQMVDRLVAAQVRYAYFHVRDVNKNGQLRHHNLRQAEQMLLYLKERAPQVKAIAWVGAVSASAGGEVDLRSPSVRQAMAKEARWLTDVCGFDGVQWDYEICKDGDPNFVELLSETRRSIKSGKILSIAAPVLWSSKYYAPLARVCDQIAVMCYDTVSVFPRSYVCLVSQEAFRVTAAVAKVNRECKVILGVPTYKDRTRAHQKHAENLLMALVGVKRGLEDKRAQLSVFAGIAPYADFTTDKSEWSIYRKYWLDDSDGSLAQGVSSGDDG